MKRIFKPKELERRAKKREKAIPILKATALNKIKAIHHPKWDGYTYSSGYYDDYYNDSKGDQRDRAVKYVLDELERELKKLKQEEYLDKSHNEYYYKKNY